MFDVITIGGATQDIFLQSKGVKTIKTNKVPTGQAECLARGEKIGVENLDVETGGAATNCAFTFKNLGLSVAPVCKIGEDGPGKYILDELKTKKISTEFVVASKKYQTAYSTILLEPNGERTVLVYRGAQKYLSDKDFSWSKLKAKYFYISALSGNVSLLNKIIKHAKKNNIKIAYNPGAEEIKLGFKKLSRALNKTDVLFLNKEEAQDLLKIEKGPEVLLNEFNKRLKAIVVITDADKGAYILSQGKKYHALATKVKVVNATGAGDAFGSAFIAGLIKSRDVKIASQLAILNSSSVIKITGAKKGLLAKYPPKKISNKIKIISIK